MNVSTAKAQIEIIDKTINDVKWEYKEEISSLTTRNVIRFLNDYKYVLEQLIDDARLNVKLKGEI